MACSAPLELFLIKLLNIRPSKKLKVIRVLFVCMKFYFMTGKTAVETNILRFAFEQN